VEAGTGLWTDPLFRLIRDVALKRALTDADVVIESHGRLGVL
jgi:hypothetical protein